LFSFLTELSVQVKDNLAISGLVIGINGHQNINQNRTLSFNFSSSQVSNFQKATSFTDFRIKINQLIQLFHLSFQDLTFKKIEITLDTNQIFFKDTRIQIQFFKKFEQATILLFQQLGYTYIHTTIHKGIITHDGKSSLKEQIGFNHNIKSISVHGGHINNLIFTFCVYDKRFKNKFLSSDLNQSEWRFEITIHPKQMHHFFHDFKPTTQFFYVVQQFCIHFRACDKQSKNHGINVLLKDIKNALQHAQIHHTEHTE
jgi:hypothetical protein